MTVIAILSDIHGNREALAACLADAREQGAERTWCLGDIVGYGARPVECFVMLRELDATMIRGNHEQAVLDGPYGFNPLAAAAIAWTRQQVIGAGEHGEMLDIIDSLPERVDTDTAILVHGSPAQPVDEYLFPEDALDHLPHGQDFSPKLARSFKLIDKPCFVGHTHVPGVITHEMTWTSPTECDNRYDTAGRACIINVGSVGQPRDGDIRASYALWDGRVVGFRRIHYDVDVTVREIREQPMLPDLLAQRLLEGW